MSRNIDRDPEKQKILTEYGHKAAVLLFISTMLLVSYLFIRFLLPLLLPFVLGLLLSLLFGPVISFLKRFFHINRLVGTAVILGAVSAVIILLAGWLVRGILSQITALCENADIYMAEADRYLNNICCTIGDTVGVEGEALFRSVTRNIDGFMAGLETRITSIVMGTSIPAIMAFVEFIIGVALVIVSLFLFVKDMDGIREYMKKCYFRKEVRFISKRVFTTAKAYIKAQFIIMAAIAAECTAGLFILQNRYALLVGVLIGVLDALPLFGVGAVLIPWTIIYIAAGNFVRAALMFTIFIVCYFTREFLEPKLIGDKIGMHPIVTLIAIYAGFRLLGFAGMLLAPFVYILVRDAAEEFIKLM